MVFDRRVGEPEHVVPREQHRSWLNVTVHMPGPVQDIEVPGDPDPDARNEMVGEWTVPLEDLSQCGGVRVFG